MSGRTLPDSIWSQLTLRLRVEPGRRCPGLKFKAKKHASFYCHKQQTLSLISAGLKTKW